MKRTNTIARLALLSVLALVSAPSLGVNVYVGESSISSIGVYRDSDGSRIKELIPGGPGLSDVEFGPDGNLYIAYDNAFTTVIDRDGRVQRIMKSIPRAVDIEFGRDGFLYAARRDALINKIIVYQSDGTVVRDLPISNVRDFEIASDGSIYAVTPTGTHIYDKYGNKLDTFSSRTDATEIEFGPDGLVYLAFSSLGLIYGYDANGTPKKAVAPRRPIGDFEFGDGGQIYIYLPNDNKIEIYNGMTPDPVGSFALRYTASDIEMEVAAVPLPGTFVLFLTGMAMLVLYSLFNSTGRRKRLAA